MAPIKIHETAEPAASAGDGLAFLTGIPGNDDVEESAEQIIMPRVKAQKTEDLPRLKEEPAQNDGWGGWKGTPQEGIRMFQEEELGPPMRDATE